MSNAKKGNSFVMLDRDLLNSPSWRLMSINCKRLLDFLMNEHLSKAGKENGNLMATYDQLEESGISRRLVHRTITEAESLGFIRAEKGGRKGCVNHISKFLITYFAVYENGRRIKPLNDWNKLSYEDVIKIHKSYKIKSTLRYGHLTVSERYNLK